MKTILTLKLMIKLTKMGRNRTRYTLGRGASFNATSVEWSSLITIRLNQTFKLNLSQIDIFNGVCSMHQYNRLLDTCIHSTTQNKSVTQLWIGCWWFAQS